MKQIISITIMTLFSLLVCFGISFAEEKKKSSWYIGYGLGAGKLKIEGKKIADKFDDSDNPDADNLGITLHFNVGLILNPKLHLGFDWSLIDQTVTTEDNYYPGNDFVVTNYFAAISFYPVERGFNIKAGGGLSHFEYDYDQSGNGDVNGIGYLLGVGYDSRPINLMVREPDYRKFIDRFLTPQFGIHAEYSKQFYYDSHAPDNTEFTSIYIFFSWF